jgi:hypothetical protein
VRCPGRGCPLFDRPKRGRKKPHRERLGTDYRPGRSIDWPGTNARIPSPFSRGRRIPAFAGAGRKRGWNRPHSPGTRSFLPLLSRGETQGRASCFARKDGVPLSRNSRASSPLPGEGGTGWVDRQRYRRLVPFPFYPSFSPLSRGETWGWASCFVQGDTSPSRDAAPRKARDRLSARALDRLVRHECQGPESLLQREKDRKRGWNRPHSPGTRSFLPLFFPPF